MITTFTISVTILRSNMPLGTPTYLKNSHPHKKENCSRFSQAWRPVHIRSPANQIPGPAPTPLPYFSSLPRSSSLSLEGSAGQPNNTVSPNPLGISHYRQLGTLADSRTRKEIHQKAQSSKSNQQLEPDEKTTLV